MSDILGNPVLMAQLRTWVDANLPDLSPTDAELRELQHAAENAATLFGYVPVYRRTADVAPRDPIAEIPGRQRITQLFVWVARLGDGSEDMICMIFPEFGLLPMVTPKPEMAEAMKKYALDAQRHSLETGEPMSAILRRFVLADGE